MAIHIKDSDDFKAKLEEAGDKLVAVDFHATWCGPCKRIAPQVESMASETPNVMVLKVDVDECEELAMQYNITSMPTFVFLKNQSVISQFIGANFEKLLATIKEHL